ncbi:MAG: hypothetical protein SGI88_09690 [Candidatus Hydrogenedentes bacterium]|nr:hypothetical protein [Candidatus Hydrogenedentota bacterium]
MEDFQLTMDFLRDLPLDWVLVSVLCVPAYFFYAWAIFGHWENFLEALHYVATPDAWSLVRGERVDDSWATMKFGLLLVLSIATVYEVYTHFIPWISPSFAEVLAGM